MTRKKQRQKRGGNKPERVLADHERRGRLLVPPLMQHGPIHERSWHREMLPDFLWIALMLGRRSDWLAVRSALEVIDRFVPEGPRFADGRLTTFALVPVEEREAARSALLREAPHALPAAFGHALGLYPGCPALWLYDDWLAEHKPDSGIGLPLLRSLVRDHLDGSSVRSTRLRMAAFSRRVTHRRFAHPGTGVWTLFSKYPSGLNEGEQRQVESCLRASWMAMFATEAEEHPEVLEWPREFWRRNRELTSCVVHVEQDDLTMPEENGPVDPEPLMQLSELQDVLEALDRVGGELRKRQVEVVSAPTADEPNAVLLGMASRTYRSLYAMLERPSAWTPDVAALHLRPIVDARILVAWLIKRDDQAVFAAYREHGLGRLKLLQEHIKADFGDDPSEPAQEALESLEERVNLERDEWFQPVNLGAFTNVTHRDMAIETGLKREYDLSYAPMSSANHGEWPTVRDNDTVLCLEPLHSVHRVGAFGRPGRVLSAAPAVAAFELARDAIADVFRYYGCDIGPSFASVEAALHAAAYSPNDQTQ